MEQREKIWIPPFRSMNLAVCRAVLDRYADSGDLRRSYEACGLNGLEVIRGDGGGGEKILPEMINGVHLYYHVFWMDWWRGRQDWLDAEFDSREQWIEYYSGSGREGYLDLLRSDLRFAEQSGAKYVVFHVSEGTLRESFTCPKRYRDEEVIDASLEIINTVLGEREYPFDFLVENLWWSGFTLRDAQLTARLIDGIACGRKGIMLDTGHFMNTDPGLVTPGEALDSLHRMLDVHEAAGLLPWFLGVHLQMSLSGEYVRRSRREWEQFAPEFDRLPFYERYRVSYEHVSRIDRHQPFLDAGVRELIGRIRPRYLTYEFQQKSRREYEKAAAAQSRILFGGKA